NRPPPSAPRRTGTTEPPCEVSMLRGVPAVLALALVAAAGAPAAGPAGSPPDPLHTDLGPVPSFTLTERSGRTVTAEDLRGKVWVVSFFFTSCTAGCAKTT